MFVVCDKDLLPELNALEVKSGIRLSSDKRKQIRKARLKARKAYKLILSKIKKWKVLVAKSYRDKQRRLEIENEKQIVDESAEEESEQDSIKRPEDLKSAVQKMQ
jgi:hypothetical protein